MKPLISFFRALADETRLRIIMLLLHGELCVCDLMAILDAPQSKLSRHLAYLKNSGLVNGRREGVWMHYSLKDPLNDLHQPHLHLFKGKLSALSPFKQDRGKMFKFKAKGVCGSLAAKGPRRAGKRQIRVKKA